MGLYVGDSDNLVLMLGDTEVSAAYLGDTQVYPMSPFAVSPSRISLNNVQLTANLRIKSPEAWTITDNSGGWLSYSASSGTAGVTVVTVTATTATADRTATITVTTANYSKTVAVSQVLFNMRYFHIHNISNQTGTVTFNRDTRQTPDLDWSTDSINWTAVPMVSNPSITVPADGYLFFRGNNNWFCGWYLSMDVDHTFGGNVLSIASKTNFDSLTSVPSGGMNYFATDNTHLVSAKDMDWGPACTNTGSGWMLYADFDGCSNLSEAPDMTSFTTIGDANPCEYMFLQATGLTRTPDLRNVTSVGSRGCDYMFYSCRNLTVAIAPSVSQWNTDNFINWLLEVAPTGIVVMDPNTTGVPTNSTSGIPTGWTRVDSYYSVTLDATNGNAIDYATSDGRQGTMIDYSGQVRLDYPQTLTITTGGTTDHLYINGVDQGNGPSYTLDYLDLSNGDTLMVVHTNEPS